MADLSDRILRTTRLRLLPFADEHIDYLHQLWSTPEVRLYLWDDRVISRQQAIDVVHSSVESFATERFGFWILQHNASGEFVGFAGLRSFGEQNEIELLYGLGPDFWGQGFATEAAGTVLDYGFETCRLEDIYAGTDPPNEASIRVIERLGMSFDSDRVIGGLPARYYVISSGVGRL